MFDIGASELLVVGVVALIVIGPKDLPDMFRQVGRFTAKIRAMGREFSRAMEEAAKESAWRMWPRMSKRRPRRNRWDLMR